MCLIVIAWRAHPRWRLVVAANRDEWRERPTRPACWWPEEPAVFAGKDLQAGGTWMGVTRAGRFAAVTNFRDPSDKRPTARSRGELAIEFLRGRADPRTYVQAVASRAPEYNGFNLLVADREALWYFGSRAGDPQEVVAGVHGLSNHVLDEPWPKVVRARRAMEAALPQPDPAPRLFDMLADAQGASDAELPRTGVALAWERRLAAPLIVGDDYGTRSSTVLAIDGDGVLQVEERTLAPDGRVTGIVAS